MGSTRNRYLCPNNLASMLTELGSILASHTLGSGRMKTGRIWLALGANVRGCWGRPIETLSRAVAELQRCGLVVVARSAFYSTLPMGFRPQPNYINAVLEVRGSLGPGQLLRLAKRLEREAGRRTSWRWGPRPLDIDILDFGGRQMGCAGAQRTAGRLQLPHPGLTQRGFVLVPMAEASPDWRHPRLGRRATDLLRRNPQMKRGIVQVSNSPVVSGVDF